MRLRHLLHDVFVPQRLDSAMDEEVRFHMAQRAADLQRSGLPAAEAERRARIEFGGTDGYQEKCRSMSRLQLLHDLLADVRFGLRMLKRNAGFSLLATLLLAVGIGANAAVFSWIEGVLLRPFPAVAHQERLMAITGTKNGRAGSAGDTLDISWPDFQDLARNATLLDALIVDKIMGVSLSVGNRAEATTGSIVSSNYFDALGVRPILGHGFAPEDDVGRNAHPVTVISYRFWKDRYQGDPDIVGKTQILNNVRHTIIGVAPAGFDGTFVGWATNFWVPV